MLTRRRIVKAPVLRKSTPCPVCRSRSGFCVINVSFVPASWWLRSTRRSPSK